MIAAHSFVAVVGASPSMQQSSPQQLCQVEHAQLISRGLPSADKMRDLALFGSSEALKLSPAAWE